MRDRGPDFALRDLGDTDAGLVDESLPDNAFTHEEPIQADYRDEPNANPPDEVEDNEPPPPARAPQRRLGRYVAQKARVQPLSPRMKARGIVGAVFIFRDGTKKVFR